ncbi:MAG: C4-type zinc ribbon domain-containing protein [Verrucomicrobiota bacterium]
MPSNEMTALLALQAKDLDLRKALLSLQSFPEERIRVESEIRSVESEVDELRSKIKEFEVSGERMEADTEAADEKIRKLKNQQLEVKKNEEYEALNHEIQNLENQIDEIEEAEIRLLDQIEEEKVVLTGKEAESAKVVGRLQQTLTKIDEDEQHFRGKLDGMKSEVEERRALVETDLLMIYDSLWKQIKRPPVVVPLEDQKCGGCHLRVSNEVYAAVQDFKVVRCDQCDRLLYLE